MPAKALVGACSDDTYPFEKFLAEDRGLHEGYRFPLRNPGGLAPLVHRDRLPILYEAAKIYLGVALKHRPWIDKVVVIGHQNCAMYADFLPDLYGNEILDLPGIAAAVVELFSQIKRVELFYSVPNETTGKVNFQKIPADNLQPA
jgi:hypothetical protein